MLPKTIDSIQKGCYYRDMDNKIVGIIDRYLEKNTISGSQFSKAIGMDPAMWSRIKNGKQDVTPGFLVAVGRAYPALQLNINNAMFATEER